MPDLGLLVRMCCHSEQRSKMLRKHERRFMHKDVNFKPIISYFSSNFQCLSFQGECKKETSIIEYRGLTLSAIWWHNSFLGTCFLIQCNTDISLLTEEMIPEYFFLATSSWWKWFGRGSWFPQSPDWRWITACTGMDWQFQAPGKCSMRMCKKWKLGQFTKDAYIRIAGAYRDKIIKAKAQN